MDKKPKTMVVNIDDFSFKTIIGILPFERKKKQKVVVAISFEYSFEKDSKDFVDYSEVANLVKRSIKKEKFFLIEDAIIYLEDILNNNFKIDNLKIKITKPDILKDCMVSVSSKL